MPTTGKACSIISINGAKMVRGFGSLYSRPTQFEPKYGSTRPLPLQSEEDKRLIIKRERGQLKTYIHEEEGKEYVLSYTNNLALNHDSADVRVDFLSCKEKNAKGKITGFSWIGSMEFSKRNVVALMKAARARWKIENETFNTLKNQDYHFEHNYGHGNQYLATVLA